MQEPVQVEYAHVDESCGLGITACNILWFILTGWISFLMWMFVGLICCLTIILIPFGIKCFKLAFFIVAPFGQGIIRSPSEIECPLLCCNILWFFVFGFEMCLLHLALAFICFITIIGIPFGIQHLKLSGIALAPIGKTIVSTEVAVAARKANAEASVASMRGMS